MRPVRPRSVLAVLAAGAVLAPAAHAATGTVASGAHDGGAFRYTLPLSGWHRVAGSSKAHYAFRLARGGARALIEPVQADGNPTAYAYARELGKTTPTLRAVRIDAHHAALVTRKDGTAIFAFAEASGPFRIVFMAARDRGANQAVVDAVAHGGRFTWAGPDVLHLPSDPAATALVAGSNAAMAAQDSYRVSVTDSGKPLFTIERVRSQLYEGDTVYLREGVEHLLELGTHEYQQEAGAACWSSRDTTVIHELFGPVSNPAPGPFVAYGPVTEGGATRSVVQSMWDRHAALSTTTLTFDTATQLMTSATTDDIAETYEWIPITVPPAPQPLCPEPPPPPSP